MVGNESWGLRIQFPRYALYLSRSKSFYSPVTGEDVMEKGDKVERKVPMVEFAGNPA